MTPPNVLFIELNSHVLAGLLSGPCLSQTEWQSIYVKTPEAALEVTTNRRISVVVANMGADLLKHRLLFQEIVSRTDHQIQIILLMSSVDQKLTDAMDFAHQCLASEVDPKDIVFEIRRGLIIGEQARKKDTLAKLLPKLNKLPTPPAIYFELRDELDSKNYSMETLANIISRDQAITVRLLKIVNSGFYGLPRSIITLKRAISLLGTEFVLGVILTAHLFDSLPLPGLNLDNFWQHNFIVSELSKYLAAERGADRDTVNASGLAGLLHDIGSLVMLANFPIQYNNMLRQVAGDESELLRLELEQFGAAHPEVGALALKFCNLPDNVIEAVEFHHRIPIQATDRIVPRSVALAEKLVTLYYKQAGDLINVGDFEEVDDISSDEIEAAWNKCSLIFDSV